MNKIDRIKIFYAVSSLIVTVVIMKFLNISDLGKFWSSKIVLYMTFCEVAKLIILKVYFGLTSDSLPKKSKKNANSIKNKLLDCIKFSSLMVFALVLFAAISIIMGAPLSNFEETFTLSALITILCFLPSSLFIVVSGNLSFVSVLLSETENTNSLSNSYLNLLKRNALIVILMCWASSVLGPLDWDKNWQIYPIPQVLGALFGNFVSNTFTLSETLVKNIKFKKR
jgi:phosphatidylinositol glycan class F